MAEGIALMSRTTAKASLVLVMLAVLALSCAGCERSEKGGKEEGAHAAPSAAAAAPAPSVLVATVGRQDVPLSKEFTAQTVAFKTVNVSPQVSGKLLSFNFREGSAVRIGQVLFQIDPAPYQAAVQQAQAQVSQAQADLRKALDQVDLKKALADQAQCRANLDKAQRDVDRFKPLARTQVIPQQKLDDAVSARDVAAAQLKAQQATVENTRISTEAQIGTARANLEAARANLSSKYIDLGYCTITSPVNGLISRLQVDPGNIVSPSSTTAMATISSNDPMYVDFSISEIDYLEVSRQVTLFQTSAADAHRNEERAPFDLVLANGQAYQHRGHFNAFERALDAKTGTLLIRAIFPNPEGELKPGQFGRIRLHGRDRKAVVLVPQRAVTEMQSMQSVLVVDRDSKVVSRTITTDGAYKEFFIVKDGLKGGERVIVDGLQKVKPGQPCAPTPAPTPSSSHRR